MSNPPSQAGGMKINFQPNPPALKANELLREVIGPRGFKAVAADLGLRPKVLYKWCEPDGGKAGGRWNPLERCLDLFRRLPDLRLVEWLCAQCGGRFVPEPGACPAQRQLAGLSAAVAAELDAPWMPADTARAWRRRWAGLLAETERHRGRCGRACQARRPCPVGAQAFAFAVQLKTAAAGRPA
jgi:hypothetical protein